MTPEDDTVDQFELIDSKETCVGLSGVGLSQDMNEDVCPHSKRESILSKFDVKTEKAHPRFAYNP